MKPWMSPIVLLACSVSLMSCGKATTQTQPLAPSPAASGQATAISVTAPASPEANSVAVSPVQSVAQKQPAAEALDDLEPDVGVIKRIEQGDLMCYITFRDDSGVERQVGATFELCQQQQYLNQRARLIYGVRSVNDCTSNEPCGKTRRTHLVIHIDPIDQAGRPLSSDSVVLSNGDWTITIGNRNSWSGVNRTGNLTYRGCDAQQRCINLTGGTVTCRNGMCSTVWKNGDYAYILTSAITESDSVAPPSTLTVQQNGVVLREITGLK